MFTADGRPFFYAVKDPRVFDYIKQLRRANTYCNFETREGNFAAATMDEVRKCWEADDVQVVSPDPLVVMARPIDPA